MRPVQLKRTRYALAPNPVWWALQGEGHLRGFQMAFVRVAGCSVGCAECDTDYSVKSKADAADIVDMVIEILPDRLLAEYDRHGWAQGTWVWITGGNPADFDMRQLLAAFERHGFSTAVAVSGCKRFVPPCNWLSVSSHTLELTQRYGNELKVVDGLNGLSLDEWYEANPDSTTDFMYRYVQPLWVGDAQTGHEDRESLNRCLAFLKDHPNWSLSRQDHKHWGVA